jgi:antitoxin (DNA-binding transcriptional repressor) of toxin-antitoxin stability system
MIVKKLKKEYTLGVMTFIPITDIKTVDDLFKKVEQGEICIITKEGVPFFELFPLKTGDRPRWKRKIKRIKLKGEKVTTEFIREERDLS